MHAYLRNAHAEAAEALFDEQLHLNSARALHAREDHLAVSLTAAAQTP